MFTFTSQLFHGDALLQAIADDRPDVDGRPARISRTQNATGEPVRKVQTALLGWDRACLPTAGADGSYGDEAAGAVRRFKVEVLGVPAGAVIDDVGPLTVQRLDAIQAALELAAGGPRLRVRIVRVSASEAEGAFVTMLPLSEIGDQAVLDFPIPTAEVPAWAAHIGEEVELVAAPARGRSMT
jgi:hypothetical protein